MEVDHKSDINKQTNEPVTTYGYQFLQMAIRCKLKTAVYLALFMLIATSLMLAYYEPQPDCICQRDSAQINGEPLPHIGDHPEWGKHKLAVIVPFRNRFEELLEFVPYMHRFLTKQKIRHRIFVVNQADSLRTGWLCLSVTVTKSIRGSLVNLLMPVGISSVHRRVSDVKDTDRSLSASGHLRAGKLTINSVEHCLRFNRATLINIGYLQSRLECDYLVMHDVDLMPLNPELNYSYPESGPRHLAAPKLHPLYHYKTFVGGILLITNKHFHQLNGMSNIFWGWGREDDEFYLRIKDQNLQIQRPVGLKTDSNNTFRHIHDKFQHPRDYSQIGPQKQKLKQDHFTGADTVQYSLISRKELLIEGSPVTILNVRLECDIELTPWCMTVDQLEKYLKDLEKIDHDRVEYLKLKLFGPNGLMITPTKQPKTAHKNHT